MAGFILFINNITKIMDPFYITKQQGSYFLLNIKIIKKTNIQHIKYDIVYPISYIYHKPTIMEIDIMVGGNISVKPLIYIIKQVGVYPLRSS